MEALVKVDPSGRFIDRLSLGLITGAECIVALKLMNAVAFQYFEKER
jgi:hypothetical protein